MLNVVLCLSLVFFLFHVHTQPRVSVYIELHFHGNVWDRAAESGGQEP